MSHTLVALMQDRPGVLHRAAGLFRRRGFNIESLAVGRSETAGVSRITLVVDAVDVEPVVEQLHRLVEVLKVTDVTGHPAVERESILVKVRASVASRAAIIAVVDAFEARTSDVGTDTMIVELSDTPANVESFVSVLRPFGIQEIMRSGRIAMTRGAHTRQARANVATSGAGNVGGRTRPQLAPTDGMNWPAALPSDVPGRTPNHQPTAQADGVS